MWVPSGDQDGPESLLKSVSAFSSPAEPPVFRDERVIARMIVDVGNQRIEGHAAE